MPDDMYGDGAEEAAPKPEAESKSEDSGNEGGTALIPTDFFQGKKKEVGDICRIKVEKIMDGEVMVSYVPHKTESESDDEASEESPDDESGEGEVTSKGPGSASDSMYSDT